LTGYFLGSKLLLLTALLFQCDKEGGGPPHPGGPFWTL